MAHIFPSIKESLTSVLPIAIIVLILSVTCVSLDTGVLVLFLFGTILLIMGVSFFTIGSTISMEPLFLLWFFYYLPSDNNNISYSQYIENVCRIFLYI